MLVLRFSEMTLQLQLHDTLATTIQVDVLNTLREELRDQMAKPRLTGLEMPWTRYRAQNSIIAPSHSRESARVEVESVFSRNNHFRVWQNTQTHSKSTRSHSRTLGPTQHRLGAIFEYGGNDMTCHDTLREGPPTSVRKLGPTDLSDGVISP